MAGRNPADELIADLRQVRGVSEEEAAEIQLWQKGKALAQQVQSFGWNVVEEMIHDYVQNATEQLLNLAPGDPTVLQAHAAASALADFERKLRQDVATAVEAARTIPAAVKSGIRTIRGTPAESL